MNDGTEVVGMGSGTFGRMAAALRNSVTRFRSDEDDPDAKAGYELFRRDISFIEGKDYFELDVVNRGIAKYMLRRADRHGKHIEKRIHAEDPRKDEHCGQKPSDRKFA